MRIRVLMDNHTEIDVYYLGEPAVSYWIEIEDKRFLLDCGYSDAFLKNAQAMGIHITDLDTIILSHGHNDHTGGLSLLLEENFKNIPTLLAHPDALLPKQMEHLDIGMPCEARSLAQKCHLHLTKEPYWLTQKLVFLGEIPRQVPFEPPMSIGTTCQNGQKQPDFLADDTALAYVGKEGLYIITGCSHAGICNIIQYAKQLTGCKKVCGLLGGLHLFDLDERSQKTIDFLAKEQIETLYPCHCTSFAVRAALHAKTPVQEVGVGLCLDWA